MTRYLYGGVLLIFIAMAIASGTAAYQGGVTLFDSILRSPLSTLYCLLPLALVTLAGGLGLWYLWRSLQLRLREREVAIERARTEFTPTERGFAPRLIEGVGYGVPTVLVNPNVVPSAVTPLEAERPEEVPEERRLAGVLGWHWSNAPARRADWAIRPTALPIPEPEPSPWEVSHVERLLLEAGEDEE